MKLIKYILKGRYSNGDCSYRCPNRKDCKIIIRISHNEINQFITNKKEKIQYIITSTEKMHTCKNINSINEGNINNYENNKNLVAALIKKNLTKPLSFHLDLIYKAKIPLKKSQIKRILQDLRNENLPTDKDFLNDSSLIKITLEENIPE